MTELFLLPICFYAAFHDFLFYKIPNWLVLTIMGMFLLKNLILIMNGATFAIFIDPSIVFAVYLFLGFLLFTFKVMGAGDAKLLAACSLWLPSGSGYEFIILVTVSGGILAIVYIIFNFPLAFMRQLLLAKIVDKSENEILGLENKNVVPYAIAIFAGLLWTVLINR